ncbi:MAG: sulfatase-like hydrolase/transferase [Verrucomicrobiota bacterium]
MNGKSLVLAGCLGWAASLWGQEQANIVFMMADDLGYGDLGCYGVTDIETPNLDQMAADGVRLTNFYANGAVCSPTRIAFLSGRYQQRAGMENALYYQEMGRGLPVDGETIADQMRSVGYATGLSGKWHVGYDRGRRPWEQGFDHFFGLLGGNHHYFEHMDRIGVADLWLGNEVVEREGYTTDLITEDAISFIEQVRGKQPFFLFIAHLAPHFPWQGPGDIGKDVRPKKKSWQEGDRATYVAMVERMDEGIGRVLEAIDRMGIVEETLVVFTSDNGGHTYSRNGPFRAGKASIWEGGTRVPCLVRWPGVVPAGVVMDQVGITMDWTATFRRLAGIRASSAGEDGMDLLPILLGEEEKAERTLFWRRKKGPVRKSVEEGRAVRSGKWKLVEETEGGNRFLYDLEVDPGESENRVGEKAELAARLARMLDEWESEIDGGAGVRGRPPND